MDVDLDAAMAEGILSEDQVIALRNFEARRARQSLSMAEKFHIFGGLNDVITAGGLVLTLFAASAILGNEELFLVYLVFPAISWLLIDRIRPKQWPCLTAVTFVGSTCAIIGAVPLTWASSFAGPRNVMILILGGLLPAFIYAWIFWRRTKFPVGPAIMATTLALAPAAFMERDWNSENHPFLWMDITTLLTGIIILAWAVTWDLTDIRRETERSQVAFWLHCCAGFFISRGAVGIASGQNAFDANYALGIGNDGFMSFGIFFLISFIVSLLLDRRSLLMTTIMPSIMLFGGHGDEMIGALFAGMALLISAYFWNSWRKRLLNVLPTLVVAQLARTDIEHQGQRPTRRHLEFQRRGKW